MRRRSALILLTLAGGVAWADDAATPPVSPAAPSAAPAAKPAPPPTAEQAADAVMAAAKAKDAAALKALAAKDAPDPWLVADELIRRGEVDVADAFARAAPSVDVEKLPAYVASRRGKPNDAERRVRLAKAYAALEARKPGEALEVLGPSEAGPIEDVVGILLATERGFALASLVRTQASAATFVEAGDAADRLGWLARAARAFNDAGYFAFQGSAWGDAMAACERKLATSERRGDKGSMAAALGDIGSIQLALGDHAKALASCERVLVVMRELGDEAGIAKALGNIGAVQLEMGDLQTALATLERARAGKEAAGDGVGAATTWGNIGSVQCSLGNFAKALAAFERAHASLVSLRDQAGAAWALCHLGRVHAYLGEHAQALSTFERALTLQETLGDRSGAASTRAGIGNVYRALGDDARALAILERALADEEALGEKSKAAWTLGFIGHVHNSLGDPSKALAAFERARAAMEALGDRVGPLLMLGGIGDTCARLGDHAKALSTYERVLSGQEALGAKASAAVTMRSIGHVHVLRGDHAKAIPLLERSVRAAEKLGDNGLLEASLTELAMARLASGDAARALSDAHRAVLLLKTLVGGLGEEQGATARGRYTALFATGFAAAAKTDDASEAAFFLESGRAGSLLESLDARDALRRAAIPEELRLAEAAARTGEARALVAYTNAQEAGDLAAIRARDEALKTARANVQEIVERIQREAKREARLWYPVATPVEDIQGFLTPGEALVLYGLAEKDEIARALVLTHGEARFVSLGRTSEIVTACEALDPTDRDANSAAALDRVRDLVVKPLALSKETKRLLVSPDGPLSYVPFAALAPDLVVAYEASGSTYGVLREEKDERGEQVLALGDPDYTAKFDPIALDVYAPLAAAGATRGGRLAPLPGTREEATAIADVKLFGKDASEPGLRAALGKKKDRWHAVHFACHGLVNPDRPTLSSLALTPQGEDDGFLTALEVLKMEIPSDLVVLSACETGKGKIVGGEGIVGLTRAFMYAGSPRVICSLWKVDDDATRALMTKFYELWNPSGENGGKPALPTAEALKQAQEFVKSQEKWKHPYFWAAWVLWGLPE